MRWLTGRLPPPPGKEWTDEQAARMIGKTVTLTVGLFGPITGEITHAVVVDDGMGHALMVTVEDAEESEQLARNDP